MFKLEKIYLFAAIFDVSCVKKKYRNRAIKFKLTFNHAAEHQSIDGLKANETVAKKFRRMNKNYWHLPINEIKPFLSVTTALPDYRKYLFNSNLLSSIVKKIVKLGMVFIEFNVLSI